MDLSEGEMLGKNPILEIQELNQKGFKQLDAVMRGKRSAQRTIFRSEAYAKALVEAFSAIPVIEIRSAQQPGDLDRLKIERLRYAQCTFSEFVNLSKSGFTGLWVAEAGLVDLLVERNQPRVHLNPTEVATYLGTIELAWRELKAKDRVVIDPEAESLVDRFLAAMAGSDPGVTLPFGFSLLERFQGEILLQLGFAPRDPNQSEIWDRARRLQSRVDHSQVATRLNMLRSSLLASVVMRLYDNQELTGNLNSGMNRNLVVHRVQAAHLTLENTALVAGAVIASMWLLYGS